MIYFACLSSNVVVFSNPHRLKADRPGTMRLVGAGLSAWNRFSEMPWADQRAQAPQREHGVMCCLGHLRFAYKSHSL